MNLIQIWKRGRAVLTKRVKSEARNFQILRGEVCYILREDYPCMSQVGKIFRGIEGDNIFEPLNGREVSPMFLFQEYTDQFRACFVL
jgi:hypothetical protein